VDVDAPRDIRRLHQLGVGGLITDLPVTARTALFPTPV
jgi:glycerophosphoryl diester phosphodiesterase